MSTYHFDFKITVWERITITAPEKRFQELLEKIECNEIRTGNELIDNCNKNEYVYEGTMVDTEQYLSIEENDGHSTLDIIDESGIIIFKNSKNE